MSFLQCGAKTGIKQRQAALGTVRDPHGKLAGQRSLKTWCRVSSGTCGDLGTVEQEVVVWMAVLSSQLQVA